MKKQYYSFVILIFVLCCMSCYDVLVGEDDVLFCNFSVQTVKELNVYNCEVVREGNTYIYVQKNILHTYTRDINPYNYHVFNLPVSVLPDKRFFLEVLTEEGEIYINHLSRFGKYTRDIRSIIFSVDYELL